MDVGGYRHDYEGFYEKTLFQMSINRGRTTTNQGAHANLVGILSFLLFLSWWRALRRRSNHLETMWIPLEARHLNSFKNSIKETCKYVFSYILDDRIIYSWCLNVLNLRFNEFRCIWCFDQNFIKLSTSDPNMSYHESFYMLWVYYETNPIWLLGSQMGEFSKFFELCECKDLGEM